MSIRDQVYAYDHTNAKAQYVKKESYTLNKFPCENNSGLLIGSVTSSFNVLFTSSRAPISSNFTPTSSGGTTDEIKLLSYSSSARLCSKLEAVQNHKWKQYPTEVCNIEQNTKGI